MGNLLSDFFCTCDTYKIKSKHTSNGIHKQATEAVYKPVYTFHTARERELRLAEFSLSQQGSCQCPSPDMAIWFFSRPTVCDIRQFSGIWSVKNQLLTKFNIFKNQHFSHFSRYILLNADHSAVQSNKKYISH